MKELKYLNKYLLKYKTNLLLGFFIIIIARILLLFTPGLIRNSVNVIDEFRKGNVTDIEIVQTELIENIFLILLAAISAGIFTFLTRQTIINVSRYVEFDLKNEIYNQYQKLSLSFYKKNQTGDLMNRISEDVSRVRMYVGPAIMYSTNTITLLVITFFYMYKQSPELTLYTVSPLPILSFTIYKLSRIINIKSKIVQESLSNLSSFSQEIFTGIKIVKSYSMQASNTDKFEEISQVNKENQVSLAKMQALFFPLMILLIGVSNIFVIYIGGKQYLDGSIESIGIIAEFIIYVNMLTWPVASLGWISSIVQQAEASQKRINEFLKVKSKIVNKSLRLYDVLGKIEFKNISLIYPETKVVALNNLSFEINQGKSLGIIGGVGSGKSTIAELILRNYDPNNGEVLIDDKNLKKHNLNIIRQNIGYVPQNTFLFSDTILNNIKFGNIEASNDDVIRFAKFSNVHNDIDEFYNKYNSVLGERGINLSGGQRQRIAISRALIKKPSILILDDSLSAVDTETEDKIFKNILNNIPDCTKIVISHRISTVKYCDKIIVINDGKKVEEGNHLKLVENGGYYYEIYNQQIKGK